jgi:hypothetical protein
LNDVLKYVLAIVPLFGALYAPFPFLDKFATPEARIKAQLTIKAGQANTDTKPLDSLLAACFGPKHFTLLCFALSSAMSLVFTILFLGVVNAYVINLPDYFERREVAVDALEDAAVLGHR